MIFLSWNQPGRGCLLVLVPRATYHYLDVLWYQLANRAVSWHLPTSFP